MSRCVNPTFNLPATGWGALNSVPYGSSEFGTFNIGSLPAIVGYYSVIDRAIYGGVASGALFASSTSGNHWAVWNTAGSGAAYDISFNAALSSATYWRSDGQVHATGLMLYFLIKYI